VFWGREAAIDAGDSAFAPDLRKLLKSASAGLADATLRSYAHRRARRHVSGPRSPIDNGRPSV
jgi:hypothetical protein